MDALELLYTTRAMRRLAPDPIDDETIATVLDGALRGPSGGNRMRARFLVVRDAETKAKLQGLYVDGMKQLYSQPAPPPDPNDPAGPPSPAAIKTAGWIGENFTDIPVLVFVLGLPGFGSTSFPIAWQLCLAARAQGLGSTFTNVLRFHQAETDAILGIPEDAGWEFHAMIPIGKPLGQWGLAKRPPVNRFTFNESFGSPVNWEIDEPVWSEPDGYGE